MPRDKHIEPRKRLEDATRGAVREVLRDSVPRKELEQHADRVTSNIMSDLDEKTARRQRRA